MRFPNWLRRDSRRPFRHRRCRLGAQLLEARTVPAGLLAVGTDAGIPAAVRIFKDNDANGTYETQAPGGLGTPVVLSPFGGFTGGVRVALGDFDGDGNAELVTAAGPGGAPHVIIWDMNSDGTVAGIRDSFFAFDTKFAGGTNIATGDIDGDGKAELVVAADAGGGPHVKVFSDTNGDGRLSDNLTDQFFPFGGFTGGVRVALGNTNNSGGDEIICAAGPGGGPHVKVYTDANANRMVSDDPLSEEFFAYDAAFTGGVYVAAGQVDGTGSNGAEIITGAGPGGGPHVKIFSDTDANGNVSDNALFDQFMAYDMAFKGGVRVAAGDTDNSGTFVEAVTAPGPGGAPHIKIFDDNADVGTQVSDNAPDDQFFADPTSTSGAYVAFGKVRTGTYSLASQPRAIDDLNTLNTSVFVPSGAGILKSLEVGINLTHGAVTDLDVVLTHVPTGKSVVLFTDIGGTSDGLNIRLGDSYGTDIGTVPGANGTTISGSFKPEAPAMLSAINGIDASGEWKLSIVDDAANDVGVLYSWSLYVTY